MAKEVILKVSPAAIRAILIDELGGKAADVEQAIFVISTGTFTGVKPVLQVDFLLSISTFNAKRTLYKLGGLSVKKDYEDARDALWADMISLGEYVDGIALGVEDTLKLSMLPYSDGVNDTAELIANGALPIHLTYTPGVTGVAKVSCDAFGKATKFVCIAVENGVLPAGTSVSLDGQLKLPSGVTMPACIINFNGKRAKTIVGMLPKTDYNLYYAMMCGGVVSNWSLPLIIAGGN